MKKNTLIRTALVLGTISILGYFVGKRIYYMFPHPEMTGTTYFNSRDQLFEILPADTNSIVFIGDSHTQGFELAELLHSVHLKNRGINGDHTVGVLKRLQPIINSHPKKIFIQIGINDLGQGVKKETAIANYKRIIDTLKLRCATAKIYIQSILPTANKSPNGVMPAYCSPVVNKDVVIINQQMKQYAVGQGLTYIDLYSRFASGDQMNSRYIIADGVHLTGEGYLIWADILKPYIE